jgi:hypothetical protein
MSTKLVEKLFEFFPDIQNEASDYDRELPYVLMAYLVRHLEEQAQQELPDATLKRLLNFNSWCRAQPRRENSNDDVYTIVVVGLYEKIIRSEKLYPLVVKLIPKADFIDAKAYLLKLVDDKQYARALALYPEA